MDLWQKSMTSSAIEREKADRSNRTVSCSGSRTTGRTQCPLHPLTLAGTTGTARLSASLTIKPTLDLHAIFLRPIAHCACATRTSPAPLAALEAERGRHVTPGLPQLGSLARLSRAPSQLHWNTTGRMGHARPPGSPRDSCVCVSNGGSTPRGLGGLVGPPQHSHHPSNGLVSGQ